jgi:hypothetical protein
LNIPKDLKVICFSNLATASLLSPSLSTITQPAYEIGKTAAEVMFKYLDKNKTYIPNENIVLHSTLFIQGILSKNKQIKALNIFRAYFCYHCTENTTHSLLLVLAARYMPNV